MMIDSRVIVAVKKKAEEMNRSPFLCSEAVGAAPPERFVAAKKLHDWLKSGASRFVVMARSLEQAHGFCWVRGETRTSLQPGASQGAHERSRLREWFLSDYDLD